MSGSKSHMCKVMCILRMSWCLVMGSFPRSVLLLALGKRRWSAFAWLVQLKIHH